MKKIINFKINFRFRETLRSLKKNAKMDVSSSDVEEAVETQISKLKKLVEPAAVYATFPKDKVSHDLAIFDGSNWVATTLYVVTISSEVEKELKAAQDSNDKNLEQIIHAVAMEATDQAVNFIQRLIREEASKENCELSRGYAVSDANEMQKFFSMLPGDKIGVTVLHDTVLNPLYSAVGYFIWTPTKRKTRK